MAADRHQAVETVLLARRPSQHTDPQDQCLLNNQYQDSRHQKAGKAVLRIKQGDRLIRDGIDRDLFLLDRRRRVVLRPYLSTYFQRHFGSCQQERFIKQQGAHIAIKRDCGLFSFVYIFTELARKIEDTIRLFLIQHPLRLFHIRTDSDHLHIGCSIHLTDIFAAQVGVRLVNHHHFGIVHHLIVIDECIQKRVDERNQEEKDHNP